MSIPKMKRNLCRRFRKFIAMSLAILCGLVLSGKVHAIQEIKVVNDGRLQTFQVHRSGVNQVSPGDESRKMRVEQDPGRTFQFQTPAGRLSLPGLNAVEIFSQHLAERAKGKIVVEMRKLVAENRAKPSIGRFAPESWIESRNGQIQLFDELPDPAETSFNRYWIGVRCRNSETELSREKVTDPETGLRVDDVVPQSAAEKSGIRVGDELISWNQQPLVSVSHLVSTIQRNQSQSATLIVRRDDQTLEIEITPDMKTIKKFPSRTLIVPTAQLQVAKERIRELKKMIEKVKGEKEEFRVLLVGPGVNFGQTEIDLQINPEVLVQKTRLKKILDQVAENKFGVFIKENSLAIKTNPDSPQAKVIEDLDMEPHEIWETMQLGVNGKTIAFNQLAPQIIEKHRVEIKAAEKAIGDQMQKLVQQLKSGQIVFPNPLDSIREELKQEIQTLHRENELIRKENLQLKAALKELQQQLRK